MSCKDTQNDRLLAEFKRRRYLTMRIIFDQLHINNPWARISELRKQHRIADGFVPTRGGARIKHYWLVKAKQSGKRAA